MEKRVTIYDIAAELNISTGTVYRALNNKPRVSEETRQAVLKKAEELGYVPNSLARSLSRRAIRLAVVAYTRFPEFHRELLRGAHDAENQLRDFNIMVDYYSAESDKFYQSNYDRSLTNTIALLLEKKYDGALICARTHPSIQKLYDQGTIVATVISDTEPSMRRFHIRYDGYAAGRLAAQLIHMGADRERPVAIASGYVEGSGIHHVILQGFQAQMKIMPLKLEQVYFHHDNPDEAYSKTKVLLDGIPDLGAVYVDSFNSQGVIQALKDTGRLGDVFIVTSDISETLRGYIYSGDVAASIFQNQYQQGFIGLTKLYHILADNDEISDTLLVKPEIIMQGNLDQY